MQRLIWVCLKSWKLDYPMFSYKRTVKACLQVLAAGHGYCSTLDPRPVLSSAREVVLFDRARRFWRDAHGWVRKEGDTGLARQISQVNPSNRRGDRCHIQIALTSPTRLLNVGN